MKLSWKIRVQGEKGLDEKGYQCPGTRRVFEDAGGSMSKSECRLRRESRVCDMGSKGARLIHLLKAS